MSGQSLNFSRLFLYYMTRKMQDRLGKNGAELGSTLEALRTHGVCQEEKWPFRFPLVNREPSIDAIQGAAHYRLHSFKFVNSYDFNVYLDQSIPIIIGLRTGSRFWKLSGDLASQAYMPVNDTDNRQAQGHAVTIVGYSPDIHGGSWIIGNSLGPKWGDRGYGILPYTCAADIGESYIIQNFAGIPAGKNFQRIDK